jgi:hypothetical protein
VVLLLWERAIFSGKNSKGTNFYDIAAVWLVDHDVFELQPFQRVNNGCHAHANLIGELLIFYFLPGRISL